MERKKLTLQDHPTFAGWLQAGDIRPSIKSLEEMLAETLYNSNRVHTPDYTQLYTFERNYIGLVIRKGVET